MEQYINKNGQTVVKLSQSEWTGYGRLAGYDQSVTSAQKLSELIGEMVEMFKEACSDEENNKAFQKLQKKADEAKDLLLDIKDLDEDPNVDISVDSKADPLDTYPILKDLQEKDGLIPPFKRSMSY